MNDECERIAAYLTGGGLFNPELANHDAVRDLLIDCRAAIAEAPSDRIAGLERENKDREIARLRVALAGANLSEQDAGMLEQAASMLEALECDERNRGNDSAAQAAGCSAYVVRQLAAKLLSVERATLAGTAPVSQEYAELPEPNSYCTHKDSHEYDVFDADQMRAFADATHTLRMGGKPC